MSSSNQPWMETADRIGARLCRDALWDGSHCNWLGDSMEFIEGHWIVVHRTFGPELYNGLSGIALYLAELFYQTNEKLYANTACAAIRHALAQLDTVSPPFTISFYSGVTGVAYAAIETGKRTQDERLVEAGIGALTRLARGSVNEQALDVLTGCAGAITPFLKILKDYSLEGLIDFAIRCGDRLLHSAQKSNRGYSWPSPNQSDQRPGLTGFSHGAAGIAWSLLELGFATGLGRFSEAAAEGFRYEQRWFCPEKGNWEDLRSMPDAPWPWCQPTFATAWCHGAPGIAFSRIRAYQISGDSDLRRDAEIALQTTAASLTSFLEMGEGNYSLCHGVLGNAESLLYGDLTLGGDRFSSLVESVASRGAELCEKANATWPCGVPEGGETPNLMLGLAGIGRFYLRLQHADSFDSVLLVLPE